MFPFLSEIEAQPSFVIILPLVILTGLPELKSNPAFSPKYHIAASF
jgi:hypothetical protein